MASAEPAASNAKRCAKRSPVRLYRKSKPPKFSLAAESPILLFAKISKSAGAILGKKTACFAKGLATPRPAWRPHMKTA
jgi:hypothetical protein